MSVAGATCPSGTGHIGPLPSTFTTSVKPMTNSNDMATQLAALQARLASTESQLAEKTAKLAENSRLSCRVSEAKGCLSIYGHQGRFPTSLYANQWERILDFSEQIREFIKEDKAKGYTKPGPGINKKGEAVEELHTSLAYKD